MCSACPKKKKKRVQVEGLNVPSLFWSLQANHAHFAQVECSAKTRAVIKLQASSLCIYKIYKGTN